MSEIDSGIRFRQSGYIVKIAGDNVPASCDINAKVGGSIIGVKTVATDNELASDARVRIGGETKALKLIATTFIPVDIYDDGITSSLIRYGGEIRASENDAWNDALSTWNSSGWSYDGTWRAQLAFKNTLYSSYGNYIGEIFAKKGKLTVDLTAYDSADYESAKLVVKPIKLPDLAEIGIYYNEQDWIENDYNFLKDMMGELGTNWVSADYYADAFTPSRPALGYKKGYITQYESHQGFYIALIPKT